LENCGGKHHAEAEKEKLANPDPPSLGDLR